MMRRASGSTLIELMVVTVMLSILATATLPYAGMMVKRQQEMELKRALLTMRRAIDRFHDDWRAEKLSRFDTGISPNGYPTSLEVLVEGVDGNDGTSHYRYLRRIPNNPMTEEQPGWRFRGYRDEPDSRIWNDEDVYDVIADTDETAIDGTDYDDW